MSILKMENSAYQYSLRELLCLQVFRHKVGAITSDEFCHAVIAWAEREVIAGSDSTLLLILASLGLDSTPDITAVDKYLLMYLREKGIQSPSLYESAMIWLRLQLDHLTEASSRLEIEARLTFFTQYCLDNPPGAFARMTSMLSGLYWELFDEAIPVFNARASEMSESALIEYVRGRLRPLVRVLNNPDWVRLLTCEY